MPELPEVETIRRGIEPKIVGKTITKLEVINQGSAQFAPSDYQFITGHRVVAVHRRAKVLIIDLSSKYSLLIHLKMTGQVILVESGGERFGGGHPTKSMIEGLPDNSTRIIFELQGDTKLYFNDQRKFGWIKLMPTELINQDSLLMRVGPEPWSDELSVDYLWSKVRGRKAPIKAIILDQSTIAGIGNIYADEALHYAKIHAKRLGKNVRKKELPLLIEGIRSVMDKSLEHGGTSFSDYVNHLGFFGDYLRHARVFNRTGEPCRVCNSPILKIRVAGRGTHYCPNCQR